MYNTYAVYEENGQWAADLASNRPNVKGFSFDYMVYARTPGEAIRTLERAARPGKPICSLFDADAIVVIGRVARALYEARQPSRLAEWRQRATTDMSYDDIVTLGREFVEFVHEDF